MSYETNKSFDNVYKSVLVTSESSKKDSYVAKFTVVTTLIMHENLKEFLEDNVAHTVFIRLIKGLDHNNVAYGVVVTTILMLLDKFQDKNDDFYLPNDFLTKNDLQYLESYNYKTKGRINFEKKLNELKIVMSEIEQLDIFKRYIHICNSMLARQYEFNNYPLLFEKSTIGNDFKESLVLSPHKFHLIIAIKFKDQIPNFSEYTDTDLLCHMGMGAEGRKTNRLSALGSKDLEKAVFVCFQVMIFFFIVILAFIMMINYLSK